MDLARKICFTILLVSVLWSTSKGVNHDLNDEASMVDKHEKWMAEHSIVYENDAEKSRRFKIFSEKVKEIESVNRLNQGYTLGVYKFSDLTTEEFRATYTCYKEPPSTFNSNSKSFKYENATIPPAIDWRHKDAVTNVKDQGKNCKSCWAFSAVAATEGFDVVINRKKLVNMSEQHLVDCDRDISRGCEGGSSEAAYKFIHKHSGLVTEKNYPYKEKQNDCTVKQTFPRVGLIKDYENVPANNQEALMKAVANQPVSVVMDCDVFMDYVKGVFKRKCGTKLNHAATVVGYNTTGEAKYWIIKNSWGTGWGEGGYMRLKMGGPSKNGLCGILMKASYPI